MEEKVGESIQKATEKGPFITAVLDKEEPKPFS